ncbi:MAG: Holliday junction resolvase RuvX [Actinobacteria bacterium]|nr:MAG: Holliday junction resolvase RuvX [Actinomycetota bacterium]
MSAGRVLGLDLGEARIGVAISDDDRRVAVPFGTVRTGAPADVKAIAAIVREQGVTEIVVGLPLQLSGRAGEAAEHARTFAGVLREALGVPVSLQDERLSTIEAERALGAAGVRGRDRRRVVDQAAAAIILQAYLDRGDAAG